MGRCGCVPPNWELGLFLALLGLLVTSGGPAEVQARAARQLPPHQPQPDQSHPKPADGAFSSTSSDVLPNSWVWGCQNISSMYPFCDPTLDIDTRVNDLLARLTPQEAMNFMGSSDRNKAGSCNCEDGGVPRLGIPGFTNIVETNSAVASHCIGPGQCATEFPSPAALAASFNKTLWREKGRVISTELRAFNNFAWHRGEPGYGDTVPISLQGFGPNINIVRDPRFGRNSELPSEDPLLAGHYAVEYVRGCQEGDDPRYQKMIAGLKHYALYNVESDRPSFVPNVSLFDLYDTYLPQYQMAFQKVEQGGGQATSVMCSYAGRNGIPSCANNNLLNEIVRQDWDREDVIVATDCGAISNMVDYNHYAKDDVDAAAKTLNGGADIDLGDMYFSPASQGGNGALLSALEQNLTTWHHVWASVRRILTARFRLGMFDPREMQPYYHIGIENINSTAHYNLLLDSAEQGMVLLKNNDNILPLNRTKTTAVLGPHIVSQEELFEDYHGDQLCYGGGVDCIRTIAEVFTTTQAHDRMGAVYASQGVYMQGNDSSMVAAAMQAAQQADQIVLCLGIGIINQEHETLDRTNITLPGLQESFAAKVLALGKPTVLVFINGGAVAFENLLALNNTKAVIEAFYPAQRGAEALFNAIYGLSNRWGKLPITLYQSHFIHEQDMHDFDMTTKPGRTYKYYTGEPMFTFGSGLSYTTFSYSVSVSSSNALHIRNHTTVWMDMDTQQTQHTTKGSSVFVSDPSLTLTVKVSNTGLVDGDEILLIYHRYIPSPNITISHPIPQRSLIDFTRVTLPCSPDPQHTTTVTFTISEQQLAITGHDGGKIIYKGNHQIIITDHVQPEQIITVFIL